MTSIGKVLVRKSCLVCVYLRKCYEQNMLAEGKDICARFRVNPKLK